MLLASERVGGDAAPGDTMTRPGAPQQRRNIQTSHPTPPLALSAVFFFSLIQIEHSESGQGNWEVQVQEQEQVYWAKD